jgi:hypothetical protein
MLAITVTACMACPSVSDLGLGRARRGRRRRRARVPGDHPDRCSVLQARESLRYRLRASLSPCNLESSESDKADFAGDGREFVLPWVIEDRE